MTTVLGIFVILTAGVVFLIQAVTSREVVRDLGGQLVDVGMEGLETAFAEQLYTVTEAVEYTTLALNLGTISLDEPMALETYLFGVLAPMEHVSFIVVSDVAGNGVQVDRGDAEGLLHAEVVEIPVEEPLLKPLFDKAKSQRKPFWSDPLYLPGRKHTYLSYIRPIYRDGAYQGTVIMAMSLYRISEITDFLSDDELTVFLLRKGTHGVVAHPDLDEKFDELASHKALLDVREVPDPFLAGLEDLEPVLTEAHGLNKRERIYSGYDETGEKRYLILEEENPNFYGLPVRIGVHFPAAYLNQPMQELIFAAVIGAGMLLVSLAGAGLLARQIARPVQRAASAAKEVARLNIDAVGPLPHSSIRELDDLAKGFNAMAGGLKAFNRYLPKTLVMKLLSEGRTEAPPEEREVAVLFTDIAGFTSLSEGMSASETAAFVNHHLSLLGTHIRKERGTIDKYIGDSIMAFWGAPEMLDNPAEHAAQAALGMARAIHEDNLKRAKDGKAPVRIRIGIHLGPLVVGDIGAPERVNYTVIGDTVNVASRLEHMGREIDDTAEVIITVSSDVADRLRPDIARKPIGLRKVKGKDTPVEVVRLLV
nr:adenylate/guanylate cyclase domain-containing protein [Roseibium sp. RKSG952]